VKNPPLINDIRYINFTNDISYDTIFSAEKKD